MTYFNASYDEIIMNELYSTRRLGKDIKLFLWFAGSTKEIQEQYINNSRNYCISFNKKIIIYLN